MQLLSINHCESGMKLSRNIYSSNGSVLVGNGVTLTQSMIERLNELNINSIHVQDKDIADTPAKDVISEQARKEAIDFVHTTFDNSHSKAIAGEQMGSVAQDMLANLIYTCKNNSMVMDLLGRICVFDKSIFVHSFNVMIYSVLVGLRMGLNKEQLTDVGLGALLHDVGKLMIPTQIMNKPEKLTDEEYDLMKSHASKGFALLQQMPAIPEVVAQCAYQHHERMDGKGYPRNLQETDIHLFAKIIGVCDVFEALTSQRVYRKPMLPHDAMEFLFAGSGTQFCQKVLQAFRNSIYLYPVGMLVTLSSGYSGVIVKNNPGMPSRPIVRILENEAHVTLPPYEIDLSSELNLVISDCKARK
ncbi:HD-GYP domain-containing protein [Brevibacillus laterosporus]|uniref:HD-GYP domain-containing protein n=1 Tax=Brevibacillus laterosporus TaxID=1465 RepID=UPI0015E25825|nr:HD-GYP domain-containing protein [Brevibacillus laterosporus]MED1662966.1 HD-GYP domain-containing protein [Brevibacillus laterosporus]MED1668976.1 HD-GYP domain-containing protein [Brevibacillus laterosporus]MED1716557.1 HD-GYP domain-containing protein [Brevibacillus laterosporus]